MSAAGPGSSPLRCVYGTRDPATVDSLHTLALEIAARMFGADSSRVLADRELTEASMAGSSVMLIGAPRENAWTARVAPVLPVHFGPHGFEWMGVAYSGPEDAIHLVVPNPLAPDHFLLLIAGNSAAALAEPAGGMRFGRDDWRITRAGELLRSGHYAMAPRPWTYDPALDRDREQERNAFQRSLVRSDAGHGGVIVAVPPRGVDPSLVRGAGALIETLVARLAGARWLGEPPHPAAAPLVWTLYASLEQKGALTRDTRSEHLDASGQPHGALGAGRSVLDGWSVASALLLGAGASRTSRFLEPAGVWTARRWDGEPLEGVVSRLYFGRLWPRASDAATRPAAWRSPRIQTPARALLLAAIADVAGPRAPEAIMSLLRRDPPGALDSLCRIAHVDPALVERRYLGLADSLARLGVPQARANVPHGWGPRGGFQRGVCLEHALGLEQGYLSRACDAQLGRLRGMGADWVALSPVGVMPSLRSPEIVPSAAGGPDAETDEAVCEAAARAHARGMRVWLTPRLSAHGPVADLALGAADWNAFFARYREFILHQALLAQRERIEGLMVGCELASATARDPERWRALIADVRRVYDGTLSYAARSDEVERVGYWDALDLVSVSFDQPLASKPTRDLSRLTASAPSPCAPNVRCSLRKPAIRPPTRRRCGRGMPRPVLWISRPSRRATRRWCEHSNPRLRSPGCCGGTGRARTVPAA